MKNTKQLMGGLAIFLALFCIAASVLKSGWTTTTNPATARTALGALATNGNGSALTSITPENISPGTASIDIDGNATMAGEASAAYGLKLAPDDYYLATDGNGAFIQVYNTAQQVVARIERATGIITVTNTTGGFVGGTFTGNGAGLTGVGAITATNNPAGYEIAGNQPSAGLLIVGDSNANGLLTTISNRFTPHSFPNWLSILSGGRLSMVRNAAVPGALVEDNMGNLSGYIATYLFGQGNYVVFNAAVNNLPSGSNVVVTASNMCNNIMTCLDRGQIPVIVSCTPAGSNSTAAIIKYNDLMAYNCGRLGAVWVNTYDALVERDGSSSFYGYLKREYQNDPASAMIHLNQAAAIVSARLVLEKIGIPPKLYDNNALLAYDFASTNNLISNGLFGGTSTATNWTTDGVGGVGLIADANLPAGANWVSITNSTLSGFTSISNYTATGFAANDPVSFCARIELWMTNAASDGGALVECRFNGASVTNGSVLRPIEYITNSIARGAVFNFRGNIAAGTTSITVLAQLTNCQAVLRLAQMKLCDLANSTTVSGYSHSPAYRGFLTPTGNGVKVGIGGTLDGNVGIKKDASTSYDLQTGRFAAGTNYVSGAGTWDNFNPGGSSARNVINLIGNQRFAIVHGGITNIEMRTNVVQVMDLVRGAMSIAEGGATSSVAFHFGAGVNFNFQTNADVTVGNTTVYFTNAGRTFRFTAEQVP